METTLANSKKYGSIEDWNKKTSNNWDKVYLFVLNHDVKNPAMAGTHFPNSYSLPLEDQIFDKHTGKTRVIRVVKGERSIFRDEQTEEGQKARYESKMFNKKGALFVEAQEDQTLQFLMLSNKNGSNPDRNKSVFPLYYLFNPTLGLNQEIDTFKAEAEALNWCYSDATEFKQILRYARVLGINTNEDGDLIKHQMAQLAKKDPKKFLEGLKNKYNLRKFYVLEAVEKGLLTVDLRMNNISWANGHVITASPVGKNPVDHFVDLSVSDITFEMTYRDLKERIEPTVVKNVETLTEEPKVETIKVEIPQTQSGLAEIPNMLNVNCTADELITKAVAKGIITHTPTKSWYTYGQKKYGGYKKLAEAINNDAVLKEEIIRNTN